MSLETTGLSNGISKAWLDVLIGIDPLLDSPSVRSRIEAMAVDLVALLDSEPNAAGGAPAQSARALGASLEEIDNLQPQDISMVQVALLEVLSAHLAPAEAQRLQQQICRLLFELGAGFFASKAYRASRFDMSAVSKIGHDLKTPISAITGFSRVILKGIDGPITDFQREDLTSINEAGQKLLTVIEDLFATEKLDAARTHIYVAPYAVSDLLGDILRTAQPLAADRDHVLEVRAEGGLGVMTLDASRVRWVLLSVLYHTFRLGSNGVISVSARRDFQDREWIVFGIRARLPEGIALYADTGVLETDGMADWTEDIELMTCRRFCEEMGGSVQRDEDQGVIFTISLPGGEQVAG